ncbi:NAD(P)H-binding protein [Bacillus sp. NEB1478]|uniref:NAD(P)H-binding protein n=1 Tax=Bacillus sp. NEB1478 TaxID=3073816 RepID=UPI002872F4B0|nr:NAD(P)H-binding protein [Bacillus sp. NEB1478]WNB90219.1 NAD(P)H-binding protein [Bacillus sp. NEB1478]
MENKTIIVAGSSGLIGREAVKQLIEDPSFNEIILLVRKKLDVNHPKITQIQFDFSQKEYTLKKVVADSMLICVGTTMKKARTKESFKEVDLHIPFKLAALAKKMNIAHVAVISAMGADSKSTFFYNRVKGEMENQLSSLYLNHLTIIRPSLLIGDRDEFRLGERFAEKVYKAFPIVFPKKYEPIEAERVAMVMIKQLTPTMESNKKVNVIENRRIHEISRNI